MSHPVTGTSAGPLPVEDIPAELRTISEQVSRDEVIQLASDLIKIPSFKTHETEVARWLASYFDERGYEVELQEVDPGRYQTIARLRGSGSGKTLMFNGHIDIDPLAYGWNHEPFEPHLEGYVLRGAGLFNMKGGIACMIAATEAIRRSEGALRGDIVLACVAGELQGGVGTVSMVERGTRADMAIVPEPYGAHNAITKHSGWTQLAISTIGFSHHVTLKEEAIDAIDKMLKVIPKLNGIEFRYVPSEELPDMPRLSVGCIIGGRGKSHDLTGPNYISDYCTILVDVRFLPGQTPQTVEEDILAALRSLQEVDPELEFEVEHPPANHYRTLRVTMDPFEVARDEQIVQIVSDSYTEQTGRTPHVGTHIPLSMGGDDCCHLWRAGIPSVLYGPGGLPISKESPEDRMDTNEMLLAAQVMARAAVRVCA